MSYGLHRLNIASESRLLPSQPRGLAVEEYLSDAQLALFYPIREGHSAEGDGRLLPRFQVPDGLQSALQHLLGQVVKLGFLVHSRERGTATGTPWKLLPTRKGGDFASLPMLGVLNIPATTVL